MIVIFHYFFSPFISSMFTVHFARVCVALCYSHVGASSGLQTRRSWNPCAIQRVRNFVNGTPSVLTRLLLAVLHSFNFTLCEAETSLKWTQRSPSHGAYQNSELHTRFLFVCASLFCFMLFVRLVDFSLCIFSIGTSPYILSKSIIHKPPASIRDITVYKHCFCHSNL